MFLILLPLAPMFFLMSMWVLGTRLSEAPKSDRTVLSTSAVLIGLRFWFSKSSDRAIQSYKFSVTSMAWVALWEYVLVEMLGRFRPTWLSMIFSIFFLASLLSFWRGREGSIKKAAFLMPLFWACVYSSGIGAIMLFWVFWRARQLNFSYSLVEPQLNS